MLSSQAPVTEWIDHTVTTSRHKWLPTGSCQQIWPTYAATGWLTKTRTAALLWLV